MKKMSKLPQYGILILTACVLLKICSTQVIDIRFNTDMCRIAPNTVEISLEEADTFFKYWADYADRGYNHKVPEDLRYDDQKISKRLPWVVKLWFDKRCISAERFYYVEQRMRSILKAHYLKEQTESVISVLQNEIAKGLSSDKAAWYENIINEQRRMVNVEGITESELKLIEGNEEAIRKILE